MRIVYNGFEILGDGQGNFSVQIQGDLFHFKRLEFAYDFIDFRMGKKLTYAN